MKLNEIGKRTYECAVRRGKIHPFRHFSDIHLETITSLLEEVSEVASAKEDETSEHVSAYTHVAEELADVMITTLTELYRRGVDIDSIIYEKIKYNEQR